MNIFDNINETQMKKAIEERINQMEDPEYKFPKRFGKKEYYTVVFVVVCCLFMLILGYYL